LLDLERQLARRCDHERVRSRHALRGRRGQERGGADGKADRYRLSRARLRRDPEISSDQRRIEHGLLNGGQLAIALAGEPTLEPRAAHAQALQRGFALDRFDPSERGSGWFVLESLDFRGKARPSIGVVGDYAHKPLVAYDDRTGKEIAAIVEHQLFAHVGVSL